MKYSTGSFQPTPSHQFQKTNYPKVNIMKSKTRAKSLPLHAHLESENGQVWLITDPTNLVIACHEFMQDVLNGKYDFNYSAASDQSKKQYSNRLRPILRRMFHYHSAYVAGFSYHPAVLFFFEQYRTHPIAALASQSMPELVLSNGKSVAEVFIDFIDTLHRKAAEQGLRKQMADYDAKITKNVKRLVQYFEPELFCRCARPVIVRLDLDYRASCYPAGEFTKVVEQQAVEQLGYGAFYQSGGELEGQPLPPVRVDFEQVQRDRVKLFANMKGKPSLFEHLVGYVWRIEYAHKAGYHLHVLLAFDGSHVRQHEWLAQQIGKYWVEVITPGRGRFHNCNSAWDKNASRYGLGRIDWREDHLRANLRDLVLPYLAKRDQYVLARPYKGCKLMGSGFVHRRKPSGRGRPRSTGFPGSQPPPL